MDREKLERRIAGYEKNLVKRRKGDEDVKGKGGKGSIIPHLSAGLGAAAIALLPLPAEAAIHYSGPQNLPVNASNTSAEVDMDNDGHADFTFDFFSFIGAGGATHNIRLIQSGPSHIDKNRRHIDVAALPANYSIRSPLANPATYYWTSTHMDILASQWWSSYDSGTNGDFNNKTGYIGVRFQGDCDRGHYHYGWIQFSSTDDMHGTVIDWAYEDQCDIQILAGDTGAQSQATSVPTLDQWGMMILIAMLAALGAREMAVRCDDNA